MRLLIVAIVVWVAGFWVHPVGAWERVRYEDADTIRRSELIVVGAIKGGSIQYVPLRTKNEGMAWEHHATLLVRQVLKGECHEKEIPIIIHYGLEPLVDGHRTHEDDRPLAISGTGSIEIHDEGGSDRSGGPVAVDATQDGLWLLRRGGGIYGWEPSHGNLGIRDPEDVQPLAMKDYLMCYLLPDPEPAVRAQVARQPEIAARATRYLEYQEVQRILLLSDPALRVEHLLPYFLSRFNYGDGAEVRRGIIDAGPAAGPYLMGLLDQTQYTPLLGEVIDMLGEIHYGPAAVSLISLLKSEEPFWARQELKPGWWSSDVDSDLTRSRQRSYRDVVSAVSALGKIGDPRAKEAIEMTRRRWVAINFDNPQIVQACDEALKAVAAGRSTTRPASP